MSTKTNNLCRKFGIKLMGVLIQRHLREVRYEVEWIKRKKSAKTHLNMAYQLATYDYRY